MSNPNPEPFSFELASGMFAMPIRFPVMTTHALKTLTKLSGNPSTPESTKDLLNKVLPHLLALDVKKIYEEINQGDVRDPKPATMSAQENGRWVQVEDPNRWEAVDTKWVTLVLPSTPKAKFDPGSYDDVSSNPQSWGWQHAQSLAPLINPFKKLCKSLNITLGTASLARAVKCLNDYNSDQLKVRTPNAQADLGQASAYVIYDPHTERYLSSQWESVTLGSAKMHESETAAVRSMKGRGVANDYVVVAIEVRLSRVAVTPPKCKDLGALNEAVAHADRTAIKTALERANVEDLSAQLDARASSKPKRM